MTKEENKKLRESLSFQCLIGISIAAYAIGILTRPAIGWMSFGAYTAIDASISYFILVWAGTKE